jgi:hypothetical protein
MKNKISLFLLSCLVLAALLLVQIIFAGAQDTTLKDILKFDSSVPITSGEVTQDDSNSLVVNDKEKVKCEDVFKKAEKIIRKSEGVYLTEGWLHISSVTESFGSESTTLPDGSPTPTKWTNELWVLLDDKGNAVKAVSTQDTGDPNMFQASVFEESIWTNITLGFSSEPETYRPTLDSGFFSSVASYKNSLILDQYNKILNGQDAVVFVSTEKYKEPIKILKDAEGKKAKEITAVVHKYYFSFDTGLPVQVEDYFANLDGEMDLSQRISYILVEKIEIPPDLIMNYFSK